MMGDVTGRSSEKPIIIGRKAMRDLKAALTPGTFEVFAYGRVVQVPCGLCFAAEDPNYVDIDARDRLKNAKVRS